jgi:LysR family transcriptional regulator, low CO2-responsive transcriptional regulator
MALNLTHVIAFHDVAAAGGFTAAARREGLSQPTLSAHVRALEAVAGRKLFARAGRGVRLTPAGEALHAATQELVRAIVRVEEVMTGGKTQGRRLLRVSTDSAIHVLPILAELKRQWPTLQFAIQIANSAEVIAHVLDDAADVAVTARPVRDPRLLARRLRDDRLVVIAAVDDPLATAGRIELAALRGMPLALRERGSITRATAEAALQAAGVSLEGSLEVETREAVLEAVAAGFGCGLVFASEAGTDARIATLEIEGAAVDVAEYVICRQDRAAASPVADFLAMAARVAAERGWLKGGV